MRLLALTLVALSPAQLLSSSLAAARAQRSVHYVAAETSPLGNVTVVGDAARDRGVQQITYRQGGKTGHATVRVISDTAYVRGDAFALLAYVGLSSSKATAYAGKWIRVPPTSSYFADIAVAVRLDSAIGQLQVRPPLTRTGTSTVQGQRVVGIKGHTDPTTGVAATETLYVRAAGTPLPVEEVLHGSQINGSVAFSKWNEPVTVTAPAGAVPLR